MAKANDRALRERKRQYSLVSKETSQKNQREAVISRDGRRVRKVVLLTVSPEDLYEDEDGNLGSEASEGLRIKLNL